MNERLDDFRDTCIGRRALYGDECLLEGSLILVCATEVQDQT
jgi:hypothetical protein